MHGSKFLEAKNGDNLIDKVLLLFIANFVIDNLSVQLSYYL